MAKGGRRAKMRPIKENLAPPDDDSSKVPEPPINEPARPGMPVNNSETMQRWIVRAVLLMLAVVVGALLAAAGFVAFGFPGADRALDEVSTRVFTPVIGMAGFFLGFYFGEKKNGD